MVRAAATTSLAAVVWENTSPPLRPVPLTAHLVMRWPVALATKATAPDNWYQPGYWAVKRVLLVTLSWCPAGESRSSVPKVIATKVALAMDWAADWRTWQAGRSRRNRPGSRMLAFAVVVVSTPPAKSAKSGTVAMSPPKVRRAPCRRRRGRIVEPEPRPRRAGGGPDHCGQVPHDDRPVQVDRPADAFDHRGGGALGPGGGGAGNADPVADAQPEDRPPFQVAAWRQVQGQGGDALAGHCGGLGGVVGQDVRGQVGGVDVDCGAQVGGELDLAELGDAGRVGLLPPHTVGLGDGGDVAEQVGAEG